MNKVILFLERMWLVIAIACAFLTVYKAIYVGVEDAMYFLIFGVLAVVLWRLRRRTRIRLQNESSE
jgi:Flp pilus assembly protein TadB